MSDSPASTGFIRQFEHYLREKGLSCTSQRRVVLKEVLLSGKHFDVEELVERIRMKNLKVGRATVYRTIGHLEDTGLVRKVGLGYHHASYEFTGDIAHHEHLICESCGKVIEFQDGILEQRIREVASSRCFRMLRHTVRISGLCEDCNEPNEA